MPALAQAPVAIRVLTHDELLRQASARFPKILGAQAEAGAASAKRVSRQGAFDPSVAASLEAQRFNSASSRGKASELSESVFGAELTTEQGVKIGVGRVLNTGAVKSPGSSTGQGGTYFVSVKYPLLRGGGGLNDKATLLAQARLGEPGAALNLAAVRQSVLFEASLAYYEWAGAERKRQIAERLLRVAVERAEQIRQEINEKQRPEIDGVEALSEVERRREGRAKAERDWEKAFLKLQKFLWDEGLAEAGGLVPANLHTPAPVSASEEERALAQADQRRPEPAQLELARRALALDERQARGDLRPSVDLVFQPGRDLGGQGVGSVLKAGVMASLPLSGQREARGRLSEAQLKSEKLAQEERLARRQIAIEVRDAVSAINRAAERYGAAEAALSLTRRVEEGEKIKFRENDSTLFLVNQRERATAEAEARVVDIQVEYEQARAALSAAIMDF